MNFWISPDMVRCRRVLSWPHRVFRIWPTGSGAIPTCTMPRAVVVDRPGVWRSGAGLIRDDVGRQARGGQSWVEPWSDGLDLSASILITRVTDFLGIVHKARRAGISILVSLGAPTHQAVLQAR